MSVTELQKAANESDYLMTVSVRQSEDKMDPGFGSAAESHLM